MPPKSQQAPQLLWTDPNHDPTRAVDQITFHRSRSAHLDITCCAHVSVARAAAEWDVKIVIMARLRTDLAMAKALADEQPATLTHIAA